jgi:hypothetical protein
MMNYLWARTLASRAEPAAMARPCWTMPRRTRSADHRWMRLATRSDA